MKKNITTIILSILFLNTYSQATIYFDTQNNTASSQMFASQFAIDSIITDTLFYTDSVVNVRGSVSSFIHTVPSTYTNYIVQFEAVYKAGGFVWDIDTNSTLFRSNTSSVMSVSGPIRDTLVLNANSSINYQISNVNNSGRYEVTSVIMHTVDTVFFNSMSTNITQNRAEDNYSFYPNPVKSVIYTNLKNETPYLIYDLKGSIIKSGSLLNQLNVSGLPNGIFILNVDRVQVKLMKE